MVRRQLSQTAPELYELLPPEWQTYLGMPAQVFSGQTAPDPAALNQSLERFTTVATDPRFRSLAEQPKFQSTYGLLRHYVMALQQHPTAVSLPPPPTVPAGASY